MYGRIKTLERKGADTQRKGKVGNGVERVRGTSLELLDPAMLPRFSRGKINKDHPNEDKQSAMYSELAYGKEVSHQCLYLAESQVGRGVGRL